MIQSACGGEREERGGRRRGGLFLTDKESSYSPFVVAVTPSRLETEERVEPLSRPGNKHVDTLHLMPAQVVGKPCNLKHNTHVHTCMYVTYYYGNWES